MQLILETDTSLIDIKSNMSLLDEEIVKNKDMGVIEKLSSETSNDIIENLNDLKEQNNIDCKLSTTKDEALLNNVNKEQEQEEFGNCIDNPEPENYETENTQNEEVQLAISNKENSEKNKTHSEEITSHETPIISNIVPENNIIHNDTNENESSKKNETNDGNCLKENNGIDIEKDCSNKEAKMDISLESENTAIVDDTLKLAENNVVINKPIDINGDTKDSEKPTLDKDSIISEQKDLENIETQIGELNSSDHSIIKSSQIGEQNSVNHSIIESSPSEIHTLNKEQSENIDKKVQDTDKKVVDQSLCPTESNNGDKEIMEVDLDENVDATNCQKTSNQNEIKITDMGPNKDVTDISSKISKEDVMDIDDDTVNIGNEEVDVHDQNASSEIEATKENAAVNKHIPGLIKLSNTLDILSDDEEESMKPNNIQATATDTTVKPCINIEDDDDVMLIDDDDDVSDSKDSKTEEVRNTEIEVEPPKVEDVKNTDSSTDNIDSLTSTEVTGNQDSQKREKELSGTQKDDKTSSLNNTTVEQEMAEKITEEEKEKTTPLLPNNFLSTCKKNLAEMTREELEDFCILKIVESVVNRSGLSEIKSKLKTMGQNMEEYKKKAMMLTKQNRDLQVVLKSVQEEQKKSKDTAIAPLKITRSVGMQIVMAEPNTRRRPGINSVSQSAGNTTVKPAKNNANQTPKSSLQKMPTNTQQQIPVPRLVPAAASNAKSPATAQVAATNPTKVTNVSLNGLKNSATPKAAEKRSHNKGPSDTVDLTDDEPPSKVATNRNVFVPPVRLVSTQNLLAPVRPQVTQPTNNNNSRKVFIPIGAQGPNFRQQQFTLRSFVNQGPKPRGPSPVVRASPNAIRMTRIGARHPAPLPEVVKQYQPPNWKALPPAPDLKLSKVENGIVISWKIEGYQEDSYEEIASYQLYAYQETSAVPSTALWKKIGDVKALPLPMACTLTQFMSGYKYFFAVRAVDIRSRLGPFSLPGSILLLSKT